MKSFYFRLETKLPYVSPEIFRNLILTHPYYKTWSFILRKVSYCHFKSQLLQRKKLSIATMQ